MTHSERFGGALGELGQQDRRDKVTRWYRVPIPSTSANLIRIIKELWRFGQLISVILLLILSNIEERRKLTVMLAY